MNCNDELCYCTKHEINCNDKLIVMIKSTYIYKLENISFQTTLLVIN